MLILMEMMEANSVWGSFILSHNIYGPYLMFRPVSGQTDSHHLPVAAPVVLFTIQKIKNADSFGYPSYSQNTNLGYRVVATGFPRF